MSRTLFFLVAIAATLAVTRADECDAKKVYYDGCNDCRCTERGSLICTDRACSCIAGDKKEENGLTCNCDSKNQWACQPTCKAGERVYDGCNHCTCGKDGRVSEMCSRMSCPVCTAGEVRSRSGFDCICKQGSWSCQRAA